jgi:hypothetical protein
MSESSMLPPAVSVARPPVTPTAPPCYRRADAGVTPFRPERLDPDPEGADDRPPRWPRVFPGL